MFCVNCLLDCFKTKAQPEVQKCFIDAMGLNNHQQRIWKDKDLQIEQKKKFPNYTNVPSPGFNRAPIPGSLHLTETYTKGFKKREPIQIEESPYQETSEFGQRVPKPCVRT